MHWKKKLETFLDRLCQNDINFYIKRKRMSITFKEIKKLNYIPKVILHCHDQSLYLVSVELDGEEQYVKDNNGDFLKSFNKLELQVKFADQIVGEMLLRHQSPYDEMIGLSEDRIDNTLEVRIGGEAYAARSNEPVH
tara:strand:+ start:58 stop:468 length:411 start_codon:yes stop_codon:yes gene_type:complete